LLFDSVYFVAAADRQCLLLPWTFLQYVVAGEGWGSLRNKQASPGIVLRYLISTTIPASTEMVKDW
jgi:hypothetical protein